jgi:hypothetical protein
MLPGAPSGSPKPKASGRNGRCQALPAYGAEREPPGARRRHSASSRSDLKVGRRGSNGARREREHAPSRASTPGPSRGRPRVPGPHRRRHPPAHALWTRGRRARSGLPADQALEPARWTGLQEVADGRAPEHHAVDHRAPEPEEGESAAADHGRDGETDQESTHFGIPIPGEPAVAHHAGVPSRPGLRPPSARFQRAFSPVLSSPVARRGPHPHTSPRESGPSPTAPRLRLRAFRGRPPHGLGAAAATIGPTRRWTRRRRHRRSRV